MNLQKVTTVLMRVILIQVSGRSQKWIERFTHLSVTQPRLLHEQIMLSQLCNQPFGMPLFPHNTSLARNGKPIRGPVVGQLGGREGNTFMCVSSSADADASSGSHVNVGGEVWNPDRSRPHSYRPITLAFSLNNPIAP